VSLGKLGLSLGYDTFLVAPPTFYKNLSDEGVIAYFRLVITGISSTKAKYILYHIPQFTGVPISPKIVKTLRDEFPTAVVGLKESEGNLPLAQLLIEQNPNFLVFVGNETLIMEAVRFGGAGAICGIANIYPELICSLYQLSTNPTSANPRQLLTIFEAMGKLNFVSAFKAVMEKRSGSLWSVVRAPLVPLTKQEKSHFLGALDAQLESSN